MPLRPRKPFDAKAFSQSVAYFPLVGFLIGLILIGINNLLAQFFAYDFFINVSLIAALIVITGGLHLDGLADTFDALGSGKGKDEMLQIMRDSHIGTMGVISLVCVILLKLSLLQTLSPSIKNYSLIVMCVVSRYALVLSMRWSPYARKEGKAKVFIEGKVFSPFVLSTLITLVCSYLFLTTIGLLALIAAVSFAFLLGKVFTKKIGGITGDTLGATNELTEILVLFTVALFTKGGL